MPNDPDFNGGGGAVDPDTDLITEGIKTDFTERLKLRSKAHEYIMNAIGGAVFDVEVLRNCVILVNMVAVDPRTLAPAQIIRQPQPLPGRTTRSIPSVLRVHESEPLVAPKSVHRKHLEECYESLNTPGISQSRVNEIARSIQYHTEQEIQFQIAIAYSRKAEPLVDREVKPATTAAQLDAITRKIEEPS